MMTIKTEINGIVILTIAMALDKVVYAVIKIVKNVLIVVEWFVNNHHNKNSKNNNHNSKTDNNNSKNDKDNSKNDKDNSKRDNDNSSKKDNDNSKKEDNNSKNEDNNSNNDNNSSNNEDNSNKENNSKNDNDNSKKDKDNSKKDKDNSKKDKDNNNNNNHKPSNKPFQTIVMVMAIIVTGINAMVYNKEENGVIKIEINAKDVVEHSVRCLNFLIKEIHHLGIVIGLVVME